MEGRWRRDGQRREGAAALAAAAAAALHRDVNTQVNYQNTVLPPSPLFSPTGQREYAETALVRGRVGGRGWGGACWAGFSLVYFTSLY